MTIKMSDYLPSLYHQTENDIAGFLDCLQPQMDYAERKIQELRTLSDVDTIPDQYIPYLAALTNAPFIGTSSVSWRKSIRNWGEVLRWKGTKKGVEEFLSAVGFMGVHVLTYFRNEQGELVQDKPDGEPYFDIAAQQWRNIRTHYFSLEGELSANESPFGQMMTPEFIKEISKWLEMVKPFDAELINIVITVSLDFGDIEIYISVGNRWEHRNARAIWSPYPRFDIVPADAIPLDYSPVYFEKHEYRTARTRGGIGGVSHPDNYFRFDLLPADFLPLDTVVPYIEGEFPRIMKSLGSRQHRGTVRTSATFGLSMGATDAQNSHRAYFVMPTARAETQRIDIRQARASPPEIADSTDKFLHFDAMPADMFPLDSVLPYREGHFLWR